MLLAVVTLALAADPLSIVGTWNVNLKSDMVTCTSNAGERAQQWLVSTDAQGNYAIQVIGDAEVQSLKGIAKDGKLVLVGETVKQVPVANGVVAPRVARLRVENGKLVGDYILSTVGSVKDLDKAGYAYGICASTWKVTASR